MPRHLYFIRFIYFALLSFCFIPSVAGATKPLEIDGTYVLPGDSGEQPRIMLRFNRNVVDAAQLDQSLIAVEPRPADGVYCVMDNNRYLQLRGKFEPAKYYRIEIKPGFPNATAAEKSDRTLKTVVVIPDLESDAHLASRGTFFPLHAPYWELPLSTTNIGKRLTCRVHEVYPSVLVNFLDSGDERFTRPVMTRDVKPQNAVRNREQVTSLDLAQCGIPRGKPGVYFMRIHNPEAYTERRYTIVVTDLAVFLTRVNGEMICNVRSIAQPARAIGNAQVQVYSHKHQLLAESTTGADGEARIRIKPIADDEDYAELLIVRDPSSGDMSYVKFFGHGEVNGYYQERANEPQCAAFVDRTLCRPSENIRATAILRTRSESKPLAGVPLQATLYSPVAGEIAKQIVISDEFGVMQADFAIPPEALLGDWTIRFGVPGRNASEYACANFQVGQFTPDQINANIALKYDRGQRMLSATGHAAYYFGTPVQSGTARIFVRGQYVDLKTSAALREYSFGRHDLPITAFDERPVNVKLDEHGDFIFTQTLPELEKESVFGEKPVRVNVSASIRGAGGTRPVTVSGNVLCHFTTRYLGARVVSTDARRIALNLKAVGTDGKEVALPEEKLSYKLEKEDWSYLLRSQGDGTTRREWVKSTNDVSTGELAVDAQGNASITYPESGHFIVRIFAGERQLWSGDAWCWMGDDAVRSANPNTLVFEMNAEKYLPGETARISFVSDFAGTALIYTESSVNTPVQSSTIAVNAGLNAFEVKVPADHLRSEWHVQVCAVGPIGECGDAKRSVDPRFASGVVTLKVDQRAHQAHVAVSLPQGDTALPGSDGEVCVQVTDSAGKPKCAGEVVIWGVDEGILALSAMKTPNPFETFYGKSEDPFKFSHIYDMIYPILRVVNGKIGGGDALGRAKAAAMMAEMHGRRRTDAVPAAVIYMGVAKLDENGRCVARFRYPKMNGSLRIMAVAVGADWVGAGDVNAIVREPVTISTLASAFAALSDTLIVRGSVFNHGEKAFVGSAKWEVVKGAVEDMHDVLSSDAVEIAPGKSTDVRCTITIPSNSTDNELHLRLTCTAADGSASYSDTAVIDIRPAVAPRQNASTVMLAPSEKSTVQLSAAPSDRLLIGAPILRLQQHLDWLNNYPHGCLEQTVSTAFPQLAVPVLAKLGVVPDAWVDVANDKVRRAYRTICTMKDAGGGYAMWPNGEERWDAGSIYAVFFQAEAKNAGMLELSSSEIAQMTTLLRNFVNDRKGKKSYSTDYALAIYTLTLLAPEIGGQYAHLLPVEEADCPPFVKFIAAMALIRGGYAAEGNKLWQSIRNVQFAASGSGDADGILDSPIRRIGLALWILGGIMPEEPAVISLTAELDTLCDGEDSLLSTQEHAWLALGLARSAMLNKNTALGDVAVTIAYSGNTQTWRASHDDGLKSAEFTQAGEYVITNTGDTPVALTHYQRIANIPAEAVRSGFTIKREFMGLDGKPVSTFKVGDLLTVQLTVSADETCENAVITDLLPAGMEIEDAKLATRMTLSASRAPKSNENTLTGARLIERCSDRLLWFGAIYKGAPRTFSYTVRCIAPAKCAMPPTQIEDMYNPRHFAITPATASRIEIAE